jgi:hypothetical protein
VLLTEPVSALVALKLTHTPFSVSSVLGLLALMGVSVETAVILVSYINKLRLENKDIRTATREAALLRLRPHDDRPCGLPRASARCTLDGHRLRHAEAICHRDRVRPAVRFAYRTLCKSGALRNRGARGRRFASINAVEATLSGRDFVFFVTGKADDASFLSRSAGFGFQVRQQQFLACGQVLIETDQHSIVA